MEAAQNATAGHAARIAIILVLEAIACIVLFI